MAFGRIPSIGKERHIRSGASNVLLDLNPNFLVRKVLRPQTFVCVVKRVIGYVSVVFAQVRFVHFLLRSQTRSDDKLLVPLFIYFLLSFEVLFPLVSFIGQVTNEDLPDDPSQGPNFARNTSEC